MTSKDSASRALTRKVLALAYKVGANAQHRLSNDPEDFCFPVYFTGTDWVQMDRYGNQGRRRIIKHALKLKLTDPLLGEALLAFGLFQQFAFPELVRPQIGKPEASVWEHYAAKYSTNPAVQALYAQAVRDGDIYTYEEFTRERLARRKRQRRTA